MQQEVFKWPKKQLKALQSQGIHIFSLKYPKHTHITFNKLIKAIDKNTYKYIFKNVFSSTFLYYLNIKLTLKTGLPHNQENQDD